jgi:drug/metabolite transporter (DMT)-like permease
MRAPSVVILGIAVLVVSTAAILIRYAQAEGVGSLAISTWRLVIAAIALIVITMSRAPLREAVSRLDWKAWTLCAASGFFLAAHIASWITSLAYTSVASSTALVTTNPIWLALFTFFVLRERIGAWMLLGIASAISGSLLIFWADADKAIPAGASMSNATLGNGLALAASILVCGYLLLGRYLGRETIARGAMNVLVYATLVYAFAALTLLIVSFATAAPLMGYSDFAWWCLLGLAVGPQLIGHTAINWSLKHLSPAFVAVAILGEPIGSAVWAFFLFEERIVPLQFAGFVLLLLGIGLASREQRPDKTED